MASTIKPGTAVLRKFDSLFGLRCAMACLIVASIAMVLPREALAQEEIPGGQMVRGTVTAAAADHLTIHTDKGDYQIAVTANTRIMKARQPVRIADVKPGDSAGAMGVLDAPNQTIHAAFVMVIDAAQMQKAREDLGKIYIAGKVRAIDDLKLTILRPDGVTQVIAVDEGTSFRRGGRRMQGMIEGNGAAEEAAPPRNARGTSDRSEESITLADIKVGNTVAGRGVLKDGVFVPTELAVSDGAQGQRRRRPGGMGAGAAPSAGEPAPQ